MLAEAFAYGDKDSMSSKRIVILRNEVTKNLLSGASAFSLKILRFARSDSFADPMSSDKVRLFLRNRTSPTAAEKNISASFTN